MHINKLFVGAFAAVILLSAPCWADSSWVETRTINGQKESVLTNTGNENFTKDMRSVNKVVKNKPKYNIHPVSGTTSKPKYNRRPDGTFDLPAPVITTIYEKPKVTAAPYYGGWAFDTFDAKKRQPRYVTYYGWARDEKGNSKRDWVSIDLNEIILKHARIWRIDPLLVEIVIRHESNFNPQAVSPVGAVGLMQLMPETAFGLGVSDVYDVDQNVAGGVQYIAIQLRRFNSVPMALAAYNAGPGAVEAYGGVPPYAETQYYVETIYGEYLAAKEARERTKR